MTLYDNNALQNAFDEVDQAYAASPSLASQQIEEDMGFWGTVGDVAMAPVRGVVGAAEGIYSLADTLAFDLLPDADENFGLGGSQTFAGSAIETIVQFGVGFAAPGIGGLSIASKLGKIGKIGKMVDAGNKAVVAQQKAQRYVPALMLARGMEAGKYAVAGAVADFTVFDGHEQRLSNLIQEVPGLENPVTEFLAADEEDPELVGRLKAALEGAGLGVMVDGVLLGVRAMRAGIKAGPDKKAASMALAERQKELIEEEAQRVTDEAVTEPPASTVDETVEALDAVDVTPERTAEELREDLLNLENMGGSARMTYETLDALAESRRRVQESSRPFKTESADEYNEQVARQSVDDRAAAVEDAQMVDEAAGTNLTLIERQIQNMGGVTEEARQAAIKYRYRLGAARELLMETGRRANEIVDRVLSPTIETSDKDVAQYLLMQRNYKTLSNNLRAVQSEWGRNLRSIQRGTGDTAASQVMRNIPEEDALARFSLSNLDDEATLTHMIDIAGGRDAVLADMKKFQITFDGGKGTAKALKYSRGKAGLTGAVTEWWMNSILSGPQTILVNGASGLATTLLAPLERSIGLAMAGKGKEAGIEFGRILAMAGEIGAALHWAKVAAKSGVGVLEDVGSRADEKTLGGKSRIQAYLEEGPLKNQDRESLGMRSSSWIARNMVNAPGKLLLGTDEFFKQLNYRTTVRAELYKKALDAGKTGRLVDEYVEKNFNEIVENGQHLSSQKYIAQAQKLFDKADPEYAVQVADYVNAKMKEFSPLAEKALGLARETTFTTPLSSDRGFLPGVGKMTSDAVQAYPPLRLVLPFVRTPTNIMQYVLDRVPLVGRGQFSAATTETQRRLAKMFGAEREALTGAAGEAHEEALSRLATGSLFFSGAALAAMNGGITGGGPKDYKQRQLKEQTGWQPYSFKIGDSYMSFQRLDPFASFLGITADLAEIMVHGDEEQRQSAVDLGLGVAMSISKNITSKTYLKGIRDVSGLLFEPEMNVPGFAQRTVASFVVPNVFAQVARANQGEMTDIKTMADALYARVPGLSKSVPPRRNMLGEPIMDTDQHPAVDLINPFAYSTVKDDKMMKEFDQIGHGFSAPRSLKNGVELRDYYNNSNQSAYDRWQELSSKTKIKGRTLKQELNKLMKSSQYKRLPYEALDGLDTSPRAQLIKSILNKYRAKAFNEMLREFPEVRERNKITQMIKGRRRVGRDYQDLLALIEE